MHRYNLFKLIIYPIDWESASKSKKNKEKCWNYDVILAQVNRYHMAKTIAPILRVKIIDVPTNFSEIRGRIFG